MKKTNKLGLLLSVCALAAVPTVNAFAFLEPVRQIVKAPIKAARTIGEATFGAVREIGTNAAKVATLNTEVLSPVVDATDSILGGVEKVGNTAFEATEEVSCAAIDLATGKCPSCKA